MLLMVFSSSALGAAGGSPPPQRFPLSPGCSITSSDLAGQFKSAGLIKGFTKLDITWRANWVLSGCSLPIYVIAYLELIADDNTVASTFHWSYELKKDKFKPSGYVEEDMKTAIGMRSIRLVRIRAITRQQYEADKR